MTAPSKDWTDLLDETLSAGKPVTQELMRAIRDDLVHLKEWLGGDYTAAVNHRHDGVDSAPVELPVNYNQFLSDLGDASDGDEDGDVTFATSGNLAPGIYQYRNCTINTGVTLTVSSPGPVVIRCTGTFRMEGTAKIDASGCGLYGDYPTPNWQGFGRGFMAIGGGGGAGGHGGQLERGPGMSPTANTGPAVPAAMKRLHLLTFPHYWGGCSGGRPEPETGTHGQGGGLVVIVADTIDCAGTALIDVSGSDGADQTSGTGVTGGGGGGGGVVVQAARTHEGDCPVASDGGAGGSGFGGGGNGYAGGDGWSESVQLPS